MEIDFTHMSETDKITKYECFINQIRALIKDENDIISILANTSAALHDAFGWFWVGFYLVKEGELRLGPFQGNVACTHIGHGKGVCGTAWAKKETIVVDDVETFEGHIACSSLSRSEIVVPLIIYNKVYGVLDIDSTEVGTFDHVDKKYLETICTTLATTIKEIKEQ